MITLNVYIGENGMNKLLRNMKISLILGLILISSIALVAADGNSTHYPKTVTDGANRTITITEPIERVVVLNGDIAEALKILGVEDKIVAVTDSVKNRATFFPNLTKKQVIGKWTEPDYEMIGGIAKGGKDEVEPNIIVIGYAYVDKPYGAPGVEKGLAPFNNILNAGFDIHKPDNFEASMRVLGAIFDKETEAEKYIEWYNEKTDNVKNAVKDLNLPEVYIESSSTSPKIGELGTYGMGSGVTQQIRIANGLNVARGLELEWPKVDWEWVIKQNPEVIILTKYCPAEKLGWDNTPSADSVALEKIIAEVQARPGASSISAIKNNRIYVIDAYKLFGTDGVVGLTYLAKMIHPEANLDPKSIEKEYYEKTGFEFPDNAITVYPEMEVD
jgi:iron complex transport system substrate-binding protein